MSSIAATSVSVAAPKPAISVAPVAPVARRVVVAARDALIAQVLPVLVLEFAGSEKTSASDRAAGTHIVIKCFRFLLTFRPQNDHHVGGRRLQVLVPTAPTAIVNDDRDAGQ